jgi:hypothetical protein
MRKRRCMLLTSRLIRDPTASSHLRTSHSIQGWIASMSLVSDKVR